MSLNRFERKKNLPLAVEALGWVVGEIGVEEATARGLRLVIAGECNAPQSLPALIYFVPAREVKTSGAEYLLNLVSKGGLSSKSAIFICKRQRMKGMLSKLEGLSSPGSALIGRRS